MNGNSNQSYSQYYDHLIQAGVTSVTSLLTVAETQQGYETCLSHVAHPILETPLGKQAFARRIMHYKSAIHPAGASSRRDDGVCPISQKTRAQMDQPVQAADGNIYEKEMIERW